MFANRRLVIASKHRKETIIAPLLEKELDVSCFIPANFDTDALGTFCGEIERKDDPLTTLRNKCLLAMEACDCDLGVASEGSFGPHPALFFISAGDELVMLIDKKNNLEVTARELGTETNFNGASLKNIRELQEFADKAGFPAHGIILRKSKDDFSAIQKGNTDINLLKNHFMHLLKVHASAYAETDMRAMYNPLRMQIIEKAMQKLIEKIKSVCPQCGTPGSGVMDSAQGLPCSLCGMHTQSILALIYACKKCNYRKEDQYPKGKTAEDPMYCDYCNP